MKLGNWEILSPNHDIMIWSNDKNEFLIESNFKILAKLSLRPDDVILVSAFNCCIRIDDTYKTINILDSIN